MSYSLSAADDEALAKIPRHKTGTKRHKILSRPARFVQVKFRPIDRFQPAHVAAFIHDVKPQWSRDPSPGTQHL